MPVAYIGIAAEINFSLQMEPDDFDPPRPEPPRLRGESRFDRICREVATRTGLSAKTVSNIYYHSKR